uniref:NADH-ubiquinone oxidoreductase chain 5 n=1 Tax=Lottia digitalis TaxID=225159 RepID=Q2I6Z6_9GAST|nr:NADH dehydrogenase subunit 5 [Lottia digitalis]ABC00939.1 NADH dehydrogenase subunit 5 [Lottia digitalis]
MPLNNIKLYNLTSFLMTSFVMLTFSLIYLSSLNTTLLSFEMTTVSSTSTDFIIVLDFMSLTFVSLVFFIATAVMIYAQDYMFSDPNKNRLSGLLTLFILSMATFITTPNIMTMLLGWDGLGVISFVLVLYYNNHQSTSAAMITGLTNRIGDILILFSIGMSLKGGHWDLSSLNNFSQTSLSLILLIAACTKSAQFPFSAWLPQAMAAPTPVSALVHSSTLVTAGVYLMVRLSTQFLPCEKWMSFLLFLSTVTSVMAGTCALVETDLKKIVALSTLSQLGLMVMGLSLGAPLLAFFHLVTHALSKSLLFISIGTFISVNQSGQDTRNIKANLWASSPSSFVGATLASFSLCGAPFITGFYSKDLILETLWQSSSSMLAFIGGGISTALTSAYSIKLLLLCSEATPSSESKPLRLIKNSEMKFSKLPVLFLSSASLFSGFFLNKTSAIFYTPLLLSAEHKYLTSTMLLMGWFLAQAESQKLIGTISLNPGTHHFLHSMCFLEMITTQGIMKLVKTPLYYAFKSMEQGWIEKITYSAVKDLLTYTMKLNTVLATVPSLIYLVQAMALCMVVTIMSKEAPFFQ